MYKMRNATILIRQVDPDADGAVRMHALIDRQVDHMTKLLDEVFDMSRYRLEKCALSENASISLKSFDKLLKWRIFRSVRVDRKCAAIYQIFP